MTDASTAPLIDGQGIPVELRNVDAELAKLWGPAAVELGGSEAESARRYTNCAGQPRRGMPGQ